MGNHTVRYGESTLAFALVRQDSLASKIVIHVEPDGRVLVHAPPDSSLTAVKEAVLKRARWLNEQVARTASQVGNALPRCYVSGETHWYLGKRYLLKVKVAKALPPGTKLLRGMLWVTVPENRQDLVKAQLNAWYLSRSREVFQRQLDLIYPTLAWVKQRPAWQIRPMRKQWGSCSPKGRLSLNPALVRAPRECIDYVITHELCHLKHHNHGKAFFNLLKRQLPHWRATKSRLDGLAERILNQ